MDHVSPSVATPLEEPTMFLKLPVEVRAIIWEKALPGSRLVDLTRHSHDTQGWHIAKSLQLNQKGLLNILKVCKESEKAVLSKYHVSHFIRLWIYGYGILTEFLMIGCLLHDFKILATY
jgi:hypothetical protein